MSYRKANLRKAARTALRSKGYLITVVSGPGLLQGARLDVTKDATTLRLGVRTSADREIGLTRNPDGEWRMGRVDEVVVAAPSLQDPAVIEVLGFEPAVLKSAFDQALAACQRRDEAKSYKFPVFLPLDDTKRGRPKKLVQGISRKAKWRTAVPYEPISRADDEEPALSKGGHSADVSAGFIQRVKREFAELNGVDVAEVAVDFRIVS